jgi:hypothetical protein
MLIINRFLFYINNQLNIDEQGILLSISNSNISLFLFNKYDIIFFNNLISILLDKIKVVFSHII